MRRKQLLKSLEKQLEKLCNTMKELEEERERLICRFEALGFLVCHQSILLNLHLQLDDLPPLDLRVSDPAVSGVIDDVLQQMPLKWPLLHSLLQLQLPRYAAVMRSATPAELATTWTSLVQEIALMLHLHKRQLELNQARDEPPQQQQHQEQPEGIKQEQQQQQPQPQQTGRGSATYDTQLVQAVVSCMHLMKAGYLLRPRLMHSMVDFDLTKLTHTQAPPSYWTQVITATNLSLRQRKLILEVVRLVTPKLQQLEAEGQELAAVTDALKCLNTDATPETSSSGTTTRDLAPGCGEPAAPPAASGPATPNGSPTINQEQALQLLQRQQQQEPQGMRGMPGPAAAPPATATTPTPDPSSPLSWLLATQERQPPPPTETPLQTSLLTHAMLDQLCGNLASWRVLTQMRGSIAYMLQPEQMAAGILACFPLMPLGSLVVDQMRDNL